MSETTFKNWTLKYLNSLPNTRAIKLHGSQFSSTGEPDIFCACKGQAILFELKVKGNSATDIQVHRMMQWQKAGAVTVVAYTRDDVKNTMELYL